MSARAALRKQKMAIDWQQIVMVLIVLAAAVAVGRRLWAQIAGFRKSGDSGSGCAGCPSAALSGSTSKTTNAKNAKTNSAPALVQIQTRPPLHLRRPKE